MPRAQVNLYLMPFCKTVYFSIHGRLRNGGFETTFQFVFLVMKKIVACAFIRPRFGSEIQNFFLRELSLKGFFPVINLTTFAPQ